MSVPTFALTSASTVIYLPLPERAAPMRKLAIAMEVINFWSGNIDVLDRDINRRQFSLHGKDAHYLIDKYTQNTFEAKLRDIWTLSESDENITISGLGESLNGVYLIKKFTYNTLKKYPGVWTWTMDLELVEDT